MAADQIKSKVISGIKWNALSIIGTRGTDFVVKLILARLLLPEAFGIVGMALVVTGLLSIFSDMGLFNALVQKKEDELSQVRYSTAFWYLLILASVFVACFFLFISPLGAAFYNEPRLVPVLNALSGYLFFNIISIVPRVVLTRQLNFRSLVRITYLGSAVSSIVAVAMAFMNFGVWSLVAKSLIGSCMIFFGYWIKVGWRPSFVFNRRSITEMAGYSFFTQINALLFYIRNNLDYIIVGKLVSTHLLGVYTLAFTLSETLRSQLYSVFNKVFFPVYSRLQDDKEQIKTYYLKVMRFAAVVTFPISILLIGIPAQIIQVFFGAKWLEAAVPLRILAFATMIFAISGTPAEVLKSIGKVSVSFYLNITNTFLVALPLMYFGVKYFGLAGIGYAVCIHYTVSRITFHYFMKKYIGITDKEVYVALRKPVLAAAIMLVSIYLVSLLKLPLYLDLIVSLLVGGAVYTLLLLDDFVKMYSQLTNKKGKSLRGLSFNLWKQHSVIFHGKQKTYKVFMYRGMASKNAEIKGNQAALRTAFWKGHVMEIMPKPLYVKMETGQPIGKKQLTAVEEFLESKLQDALLFEVQPASQLYHFEALRKTLKPQIDERFLYDAESILETIKLPVTSAHGDLHIKNMVMLKGKIKVIDWSMFAEKGSFVTDYIHYYNYNRSSIKNDSWAETILREEPYLQTLAQLFNTTTNHLRLAYAISRISGSLAQLNNGTKVPPNAVAKYRQILKTITNEFNTAAVQRSDSLI